MVTAPERAPSFTLPDVDGRAVSLTDALAAGPVVVGFFKTTCATSRTAFPYWQRLRTAYPQAGWSIVGVCQDDADATAAWMAGRPVSFPVLVDGPDLQVSRAFDPPVSPTIYLVDSDGSLLFVGEAFAKVDLNELSARIAAHVGVEPVVVAPPDDGTRAFRPG